MIPNILDTHDVVHGPATSVSPGSLLEMQDIRLHPRLTEFGSFNKIHR